MINMIIYILLTIHFIQYTIGSGFITNAINGALNEIGNAPPSSDYSYEFIMKETFGTLAYPLEPPICGIDYPDSGSNVVEYEKLKANKFIMFGTSSITRPPKYYNCTEDDEEKIYINCMGFEAYLAQVICNRIALHYDIESIQAKFYLTDWVWIVDDLYADKYDVILSGMGVRGTWIYNGESVNRDTIIDFTCPYQLSESALVYGIRPLPEGIGNIIDHYAVLNRSDIIISADSGTGMEEWILKNLPLATYRPCGGNFSASSADCKKWTIGGEVHIYIAPILNALYDDELLEELTIIYKFRDGDKPISMGLRIVADSVGLVSVVVSMVVFILLYSV